MEKRRLVHIAGLYVDAMMKLRASCLPGNTLQAEPSLLSPQAVNLDVCVLPNRVLIHMTSMLNFLCGEKKICFSLFQEGDFQDSGQLLPQRDEHGVVFHRKQSHPVRDLH